MGPNKFLEELGKVLAWADLSKSDWSVIEKYAKNGNSKKLLQFLGRTGITKQDYANAEKIISQMKENKVLKFNDFVNESKLNEGDMTKQYDGFVIHHSGKKKDFKFRYLKGYNSKRIEDGAMKKIMGTIGGTRPELSVTSLIKKGDYDKTNAEETPDF